MKKKVLSLAVLMASVFTFGTMAQTNAQATDNNKTCTEASCPKAAKGMKGNKKMKGERPNPFDGINLTADQQARLKVIRDNAKQQREAAKAEKSKAVQGKVEKGKFDKDRADRRPDFSQKRKDYLGQIKEVLTPEQYVVFLENSYFQQAPMKKGPMVQGKMAKRDGKKDFKGSKEQKNKSGKGRIDQKAKVSK